jgi:hypothetical protein
MNVMTHLIAAPILLPLLTAPIMLMLGERHRPLKAKINLFSSLLGLFISVMLLQWTQTTGVPGSIGVYLPGNWQAPPNFFDPFWRAKLHPFMSREEARNAAQTAGDTDGANNAGKVPVEGAEF